MVNEGLRAEARQLGIDESTIVKTPDFLLKVMIRTKKSKLKPPTVVTVQDEPEEEQDDRQHDDVPIDHPDIKHTPTPEVDVSDMVEAKHPLDQGRIRYQMVDSMVQECKTKLNTLLEAKTKFAECLLEADLKQLNLECDDLVKNIQVGESEKKELEEWYYKMIEVRRNTLRNIQQLGIDSTGKLQMYIYEQLNKPATLSNWLAGQ